MAIVGGDIFGVSIAGVNFSVASGSNGTLTLGGYKPTTRRMGDGSTIVTGEAFDWSMNDVDLAIDASSNQLDYLQSVANALELVPITVTLVDGTVYQGKGIPTDDHPYSTAKATATVTIMGAGQLTKQQSSFI